MKKSNYLLDYFYEKNQLLERLTINKKIFLRSLAFIICSICYPIIIVCKTNVINFSGELQTNSSFVYIKIIMIACYIISFISLILIGWYLINKTSFDKVNKRIKFNHKTVLFNILDWGSILPICCVIATFCYSFLFIITPISGNSMNPTIENGESVFISYLDRVDQFDVIVTKITTQDNFNVLEDTFYIKRVIGLPGQTIKYVNNQLIIDGKAIDEEYFPDGYLESIYPNGTFETNFRYKDENGKTISTNVIPEGYYFVMGDNRNFGGSKDSREVGLIPAKNIVGVAKYHMWFVFPRGKIV